MTMQTRASPHLILSTLTIVAIVLFTTKTTQASDFEIAPVLIELQSGRMTDAIRVVNKDNHDISLQTRAFDWTQIGGTDELTSTPDILVSPPLFTLPPGATQVIRVVLQKPAVDVEKSYRLLIDEIGNATESTAVQFRFRISMPIFAAPPKQTASRLTWQITAGTNQAAQLVAKNQGTRRTKVTELKVQLVDGKPYAPTAQANPYVLAGAERRYEISPEAGIKPGSTVRISALTDMGQLEWTTVVAP